MLQGWLSHFNLGGGGGGGGRITMKQVRLLDFKTINMPWISRDDNRS